MEFLKLNLYINFFIYWYIKMYYLVYLSYYKQSLEQLVKDVTKFQMKNNQHSVTGFLLYKESHILQYIEGDYDTLVKLYTNIKRDPNHTHITKILEGKLPERLYNDWNMDMMICNNIFPDSYFIEANYINGNIKLDKIMKVFITSTV
jgi:hypothetical protein